MSESFPQEAAADTENTSQFVGFQIGSQQYAFRIEQIQEIVIPDQVTQTPQVASCVEGVCNLRGAIIPIINLRRLLGLPHRPKDAETRTIVVNVDGRTMGCTVDAVSQVIRVADDAIQAAPEALTGNGNHDVAGFAKLGDGLLVVLDINELLSAQRLQRFQDSGSDTSS